MPYFAYIVGGWVQKEGKFCLRNKSMAPYQEQKTKNHLFKSVKVLGKRHFIVRLSNEKYLT